VRKYDLMNNAQRLAEEAVQLLDAEPCPSITTTLILDGNQLGLQIHESIGHPTELDRVLGSEAAYAGMSFVTPEKRGNLKYGSDIMHVTHDSTLAGGLGSFGYDDDGVKSQRVDLIKNGLFLNYLTSRETAHVVGDTRSNGTNRADGWNRIPIIRMTNINLEPGAGTLAELIADTKEGVFMSTNRSWSIDDRRLNFQFGCEIAWEIVDGKLGRMFKNPNYTGITPVFWGSLDRICGPEEWVIWGTPNCGKGQPGQTAHVAHGAAPSRFRNVQVGIRG
jgi:TldD protein